MRGSVDRPNTKAGRDPLLLWDRTQIIVLSAENPVCPRFVFFSRDTGQIHLNELSSFRFVADGGEQFALCDMR